MAKPPKYAEQARVLRAVADNLAEAASAETGLGFVSTLQDVADTLDPPKGKPAATPEPEPEPPVTDEGAQTDPAPEVAPEGGQTEPAGDATTPAPADA